MAVRTTINAVESARKAVSEVRRTMSECTDGEKATYQAFIEEFESELVGWNMRLDELDEELE